MIDKEACVPKASGSAGTEGADANGPNGHINGHINGQVRKTTLQQNGKSSSTTTTNGDGGGSESRGAGDMDVDEEL